MIAAPCIENWSCGALFSDVCKYLIPNGTIVGGILITCGILCVITSGLLIAAMVMESRVLQLLGLVFTWLVALGAVSAVVYFFITYSQKSDLLLSLAMGLTIALAFTIPIPASRKCCGGSKMDDENEYGSSLY